MASVLPVPDRRLTRLAAREPAHRLSVDEYHRMLEAGILDEDDRVELLEGVIVRMSPRSPPHAHVIQRLTRHLNRTLGDEYVVLPQLPLTLGDFSEPEPDLAVVRAEDAASAEEHPRTACLVIEVAKATLRKDRQLKAGLYARFAIPEYWIFNMKERCVEVHRDPDPDAGRYRTALTCAPDATLESSAVPGLRVALGELFG